MIILTALLIVAIGMAGLLLYMLKEAFSNNVEVHNLAFSEFPKTLGEISVFFISDIHRRTISDKVLSKVGKADIVIIGGDLTEKGVPFDRVNNNIRKLREAGPVYFVWGNNDYEVDYHLLDASLLENKVKILDNTAVIFESNEGEKLSLLGIDDIAKKRDRLDLALSDADPDSFKILVSHNPQIIGRLVPEHNISLILSGHTHGGQIHILGYSPYKRGGIKKVGNSTILISNGYGTTSLPLRLGAPAQCHLITITGK